VTTAAGRLDETPAAGAIPRLELAPWRERHGVIAGITLRGDGFDLGLHSPEPAGTVLDRWHRLFSDLSPAFRGFALGRQVHGSRVVMHPAGLAGWLLQDGIDGHVTAQPGTLLLVTVADCVPVYLLHPPSRTVALLHAGWRGTVAGVLETGVRALITATRGDPAELVMHCGVSICESCYEVGPEVHQALRGRSTAGPAPIDLRAELADRAVRLGLRTVTQSGWCAAHHATRFFSHRRSRGADGRMVAYLGLPLLDPG
jgi:copper oxidase (laccase) domain-containing protein